MGFHENIDHSRFPKQSSHLLKKVNVCFDYDTKNSISGVIVRDDVEDPYLLIIMLTDGRYVMSTECQYQFHAKGGL